MAAVPPHGHTEYATDGWLRRTRAALQEADAALDARVTALEAAQPVVGPQGEPGPPGPQGLPGPKGEPGAVFVDGIARPLHVWADGTVRVLPEPAVEQPGPTPYPGLASGAVTLQQAIDAVEAGTTVHVPPRAYAPVKVPKPLSLVATDSGVVVAMAASTVKGIECSAPDVVLDGIGVSGLAATSTEATAVWAAEGAHRLVVRRAIIEDLVYAGVMVISSNGVVIEDSTVRRITCAAPSMNGYGVAFSNFAGRPVSTDGVVRRCVIDGVPDWHGLDTHGGRGIRFLDNHVSHTNRAIFLTSGASDCEVSGNVLDQPTRRRDVLTRYPYNMVAITVVPGVTGTTGTGNRIDGWPTSIMGSHAITGSVVTNPLTA